MVVILFVLYFLFHPQVLATEQEDLNRQISDYSSKLSELSKAKSSLSNELSKIDITYSQAELKIKQTELNIKSLNEDIKTLNQDISNLDENINQTTLYLLERIKQSYRMSKKMPPYAFLFSDNFNNYLDQFKYISVVQLNNRQNIEKDETLQQVKKNKKQELSDKQQQLNVLQKNLTTQQVNLINQKKVKNQLLVVTNNDEKKYQQLLTDAQNQLGQLRNFSNTADGSVCLSSSPGYGNDGNFYSQRDPSWCKQLMGNSNDPSDTIGAVGCYVSSISMVFKKLGFNTTPSIYATNPLRFTLNTAYARDPTPPPGYIYKKVSYNSSTIKNEFDSNRYVIAELKMGKSQHFIVLISGTNGNFKMHDPWYGSDLDFSSHYSISQIQSLRLITK